MSTPKHSRLTVYGWFYLSAYLNPDIIYEGVTENFPLQVKLKSHPVMSYISYIKLYFLLYNVAPTGEDVAVRYKKEAHGVQRIDFIPKQAGNLFYYLLTILPY
jgi:hypothetical protein